MARIHPLIVEIDALARHAASLPAGTETMPLSVASHPLDETAAPGDSLRRARAWALEPEDAIVETPVPDDVRKAILFRSGTSGSFGAANAALDAALAGKDFLSRPPLTSMGRREAWLLPGLATLLRYRQNGTVDHFAAANAATAILRDRLEHLAPRDNLQIFVRLPGASAHSRLASRAREADSIALWASRARPGAELAEPIHYRHGSAA